jgi:hypothetical protein
MSVHRLFITLSLAGLCVGSARIATAASVTGAGRLQSGSAWLRWCSTTPPAI